MKAISQAAVFVACLGAGFINPHTNPTARLLLNPYGAVMCRFCFFGEGSRFISRWTGSSGLYQGPCC